MTIQEAIRTYLMTVVPVTALIGNRMYDIALPAQVMLPAISYFVVSEPGNYTHQGSSHLRDIRMQFSCWGKTYATARAVVTQVLTALEAYTGTLSGLPIGHCLLANIRDVPEPEANVYHIAVDFMIGYET